MIFGMINTLTRLDSKPVGPSWVIGEETDDNSLPSYYYKLLISTIQKNVYLCFCIQMYTNTDCIQIYFILQYMQQQLWNLCWIQQAWPSICFHAFSFLSTVISHCTVQAWEILTEFWDAVCKNNHKTVFAQGQTTGSKKLQTEDTSYKQMVCFQCFKLTLALSHAEFITATM